MNTELKVVCQALAADLAIIYLDLRFAHLATVDLFRKVSGKGKMTDHPGRNCCRMRPLKRGGNGHARPI